MEKKTLSTGSVTVGGNVFVTFLSPNGYLFGMFLERETLRFLSFTDPDETDDHLHRWATDAEECELHSTVEIDFFWRPEVDAEGRTSSDVTENYLRITTSDEVLREEFLGHNNDWGLFNREPSADEITGEEHLLRALGNPYLWIDSAPSRHNLALQNVREHNGRPKEVLRLDDLSPCVKKALEELVQKSGLAEKVHPRNLRECIDVANPAAESYLCFTDEIPQGFRRLPDKKSQYELIPIVEPTHLVRRMDAAIHIQQGRRVLALFYFEETGKRSHKFLLGELPEEIRLHWQNLDLDSSAYGTERAVWATTPNNHKVFFASEMPEVLERLDEKISSLESAVAPSKDDQERLRALQVIRRDLKAHNWWWEFQWALAWRWYVKLLEAEWSGLVTNPDCECPASPDEAARERLKLWAEHNDPQRCSFEQVQGWAQKLGLTK